METQLKNEEEGFAYQDLLYTYHIKVLAQRQTRPDQGGSRKSGVGSHPEHSDRLKFERHYHG